MDELQVFTYEKKEVRTIQKNGETWWVLKDVCGALGLSNPTVVADRLDVVQTGFIYNVCFALTA